MIGLGWRLGGTNVVGTVMTGLLVGPAWHYWLGVLDPADAATRSTSPFEFSGLTQICSG